jgi:hypothetical protein
MYFLTLQDLRLPAAVHEMSEQRQMSIAYAVEERNCLQAEIDLASRRCRQLVFAAHNHALEAENLNAKRETVGLYIFRSMRDVIGEGAPRSDPARQSSPTPSSRGEFDCYEASHR